MKTDSDDELLRGYVRGRSEEAFAGLIQRHLNLVYSAALRQVRSEQLAEEVAQSVFTDLARNAERLKSDTILTAWLYKVTRRTAIDVVRRESRRQARERLAVEMADMNAATDWTHIEPLLDEAMSTLDDTDRAAVLLRYFENKSLREVGQTLGTSDDAAQKRVSRAVDRLREFFAKREITVAAGGLIVVISTNAVQAAPAGLAVTLSAAAAIAGTAALTTATTTATSTAAKAIVMTTTQKICITAAITAAVGLGIFEAHQNSTLRERVESLQQQRAPAAEQMQALQKERDNATNRLAALRDENEQLKSAQKSAELLKLRGEVGVLRRQAAEPKTDPPSTGMARLMGDPTMKEYIHQVQLKMIKERYSPLFQELKLTPEATESFSQIIGDLWMKGSDMGSSLTKDGVNREKATEDMKNAYVEIQSQLKTLLGDAGFAKYNEFNLQTPGRTTVKQLDDTLGQSPLTDEQRTRLVQAVAAEPYNLTHGIAGELDPAFFGSQADIDQHFADIAASNQRVREKAAEFMTPEQLAALSLVQSNSVSAQKIQGAALTQKH